MNIDYIGQVSVGGLIPTTVSLLAGIRPRMLGQLNGALRVGAQLAFKLPTLQARLAAVARLAARLALQPPTVKFKVGANAALIAALQAQLAALADLRLAFGSAGVDVFRFHGKASEADAIAAAIRGGLPGGRGSDVIDGFVFATRYPSTFAAMLKVFIS